MERLANASDPCLIAAKTQKKKQRIKIIQKIPDNCAIREELWGRTSGGSWRGRKSDEGTNDENRVPSERAM